MGLNQVDDLCQLLFRSKSFFNVCVRDTGLLSIDHLQHLTDQDGPRATNSTLAVKRLFLLLYVKLIFFCPS